MLKLPHLLNENLRITTLRALSILDTPPDERFDRLTRLARYIFGVPISLISLVDSDRQWFKSCNGLPFKETPREVSFCAHAIAGDDIFVVPDASVDERFRDIPLVTDNPKVRFYAGYPLKAENGSALGTLCLMDVVPRDFTDEHHKLLADLGGVAKDSLNAIQMATIDDLTRLSNRRGFEISAKQAIAICEALRKPVSLFYFDLDAFKQVNDTYGHAEGDRALAAFGNHLTDVLKDTDIVARLGGDEFVALLPDIDSSAADKILERLSERIKKQNETPGRQYPLSYSVGHVEFDRIRHISVAALLADGDAAMYIRKQVALHSRKSGSISVR